MITNVNPTLCPGYCIALYMDQRQLRYVETRKESFVGVGATVFIDFSSAESLLIRSTPETSPLGALQCKSFDTEASKSPL